MLIRNMEKGDLPRITTIAQRGMDFDFMPEALVREKTLEAKDYIPDFNVVCEVEGKVVGFGTACVRSKNPDGSKSGCIRLLVTDRSCRRKGVGTLLLKSLEERMKSAGIFRVTIMDAPKNYLTPGVDFRSTDAYCFLMKNGYEVTGKNQSLSCPLQVREAEFFAKEIRLAESHGFAIRRAEEKDKSGLVKFLQGEWPGWVTEVENCYDNDPISVFVAEKDGEIVAFSGYRGNNKALPWFGPMGTAPVCRGKGIGALLLRLCMQDLAQLGWERAIIPWVGPIPFYAKTCGAIIDRCFWTYGKDL